MNMKNLTSGQKFILQEAARCIRLLAEKTKADPKDRTLKMHEYYEHLAGAIDVEFLGRAVERKGVCLK